MFIHGSRYSGQLTCEYICIQKKWKLLSHVWLCDPMDYMFHGILQDRILEWEAFPFSRGSSQPRDRTQVSHIAGGCFTSWATREAQECSSGWPIPFPADLPDPRIKLRSPALQADSLPTELSGSPLYIQWLYMCVCDQGHSFDCWASACVCECMVYVSVCVWE